MKHVDVVCAIIINDNNEVFCAKRGPGRELDGFWEFPGGKIEQGERQEEAIVREIKEELNSTIKPIKFLGKVEHIYSNLDKPFSITMYGYLAKLVEGNLTISEHTEKRWFKIENLKDVEFAPADIPFTSMIKENFKNTY